MRQIVPGSDSSFASDEIDIFWHIENFFCTHLLADRHYLFEKHLLRMLCAQPCGSHGVTAVNNQAQSPQKPIPPV